MAQTLARQIPFEFERNLVQPYAEKMEVRDDPVGAYLQRLADRLSAALALPQDMSITVHYVDQDTVNAFATLGGHVVVFRGLLEKLPDENALAMVMSHEIAHIKHRHPIMSLGRGLVVGLAIAALVGASGGDLAGNVLGETGLLTMLSFNRDQEREADRTGLEGLARLYGHVTGADALFRTFQSLPGSRGRPPEFLNSHPDFEERIRVIRRIARERGWAMERPTRPLPEAVTGALAAGGDDD